MKLARSGAKISHVEGEYKMETAAKTMMLTLVFAFISYIPAMASMMPNHVGNPTSAATVQTMMDNGLQPLKLAINPQPLPPKDPPPDPQKGKKTKQ
jgi:hypothetical protein